MTTVKRRLLIAGSVAWALAVAGLAYYSSRNDPPTARDQTTIAEGLPILDEALARVAAALDPETSVVALSGYTRTDSSCRITSAREGTKYERVLQVYVRKDSEADTVDRIRAALPASYDANAVHGMSTHVLTADAGGFVSLRGGMVQPGQLRFTADTGCRIQNAAVEERAPQPDANRAPIQAILDTLKLSATDWKTHRLTCPAGGTLSTVEAVTAGDVAPLRSAVTPASVILDDPKLFAYRTPEAAIAVRIDTDRLVITATTPC